MKFIFGLILSFFIYFPLFSQNPILFSDDFESNKIWTIFEEIVAGNNCYGAGIGEVTRSTDVAHRGTTALRVWSNKNQALKSNHVIGAHHVSNTTGITGHLKYGMWIYAANNLGLTQTGPEFSVQSTRLVGGQNLTYIAGIQYIGNQWITDSKWNIWHNGVWTPIKINEFGTTLSANTWYYVELEFDMSTNKYIAFSVKGGGIDATIGLSQSFENATNGFQIIGENRGWTPSYFVTAECQNLWTNCTEAKENKVYFDDLKLEQIYPTPSPTSCYQLVWQDEFNGTSLDATKWTPIVGPGGVVAGNNELQHYTARTNNIQVSDGLLKVIALSENYGGNAYTSGRMQSKNMGDWLYGRMEARMKLPVAQGMWPAFWMLPTDNIYGNWPKSGEIDIMELIGKHPNQAFGTIHSHDNGAVKTFSSAYTLPTGTFADDFHLFATEWSPTEIKFFVDGNLYATKTPSDVSPYPWVFDKRFFLLLNLAIGGDWAGAPDGTTTFPQVMEVDYVRVYQKLNNISIVGKTLIEPNTNAVTYSVANMSGVTYQWAVTGADNSIASGQGTNQITINWGTNSGQVSVAMNDGCFPTATASTNVTVSPNLWTNYGFEQNYVDWDTRPAYSNVVNFNINTTTAPEGSKFACATVNTAQANPWNIQLSRINLNLIGGIRYLLRFKAKADGNRTIPIAFIRSSDFAGIAYQAINLTTDWQTFSLSFTPTTNVTAMFNADLASQLGTYCFDDFLFAREALLPIKLNTFEGESTNEGNLLKWVFEDDKDLKNIEIQQSINGQDFTTIALLDKKQRSFTDENAYNLTYYRLKMNELDGIYSFSKIIVLQRENNNFSNQDITIFPNPTNDIFTIQFDDSKPKVIYCQDIYGRILFTKKIDTPISTLQLSAKTLNLTQGLYFFKTDKVGGKAQKVVIW